MIKILFWGFIGLIFYSYFGYPLFLFILSFFCQKKTKQNIIFPSVSLLIPVYNEEKIIEAKIKNSLELEYPKDKLEIIVASESTDNTNEIVKKYEKEGVKLFSFNERKGKQHTVFKSIPQCKGEIIVLTDANGIFKKDAIKKLVRNFADEKIGCVSGQLKYVNSHKKGIGEGEGIYWKYEMLIKKLESKFHSLLGANGSIYAIRKKLYSPISPYRSDDFDIPVKILLQGYGAILEPEAISEEEVYSDPIANFKRKKVIVGWHFINTIILLIECLKKLKLFLIFQLISHKFLRWLVGFFLIFIFVINYFLIKEKFYLILFLIQILFYLFALFGFFQDLRKKKLNRIVNIVYYFCLVNLASLIGVITAIFGLQSPTWEKVR